MTLETITHILLCLIAVEDMAFVGMFLVYGALPFSQVWL